MLYFKIQKFCTTFLRFFHKKQAQAEFTVPDKRWCSPPVRNEACHFPLALEVTREENETTKGKCSKR